MRLLASFAARLARSLLLVLVAAGGTILVVRFAPGFFSDPMEMDAKYADSARSQLQSEATRNYSFWMIATDEGMSFVHGDLGLSRQYSVPVRELLNDRVHVSGLLLARGIALGWLMAAVVVFPVSAMRRGKLAFSFPFTVLLAIPTAAMATACILAEVGGPVLVLALLIAAREFKFLRILLESAWHAPHLLQGRAQGLASLALLRSHILPNVAHQLSALATLSIVTALGALLPIEVLFTVPGVGQLAWSAVMNRDLPVLVATSILMACVVALAGLLSTRSLPLEAA